MRREMFDEGMAMISRMFRKPLKADNIAAIWDDVKDEPDSAMTKTFYRVEIDFHPDALVPVGKIRDVIKSEGKKIREKEAVEREQEARRVKDGGVKSIPDGHTDHSRACCAFLKAAFSGVDNGTLRKMAEDGESRFPGRGFDAWLNGALSIESKSPMSRRDLACGSD